MGRSQVKYRATHGRGRGRGSGGEGRGHGGRGRSRGGGGRRPLESNAFRFQEREEADDDAENDEGADVGGRTQFFSSERNYRVATAAVPDSYFQSRVMKQWEETDDGEDPAASTAVGVLDFDWIAEQLKCATPSVRYRIDPKYCVDLPFELQDDVEQGEEENTEHDSTSVSTDKSLPTPVPVATTATTQDSELDFLLNLSASTSTSGTAPGAMAMSSSTVGDLASAATAQSTTAPPPAEELEEWLDDVLDM